MTRFSSRLVAFLVVVGICFAVSPAPAQTDPNDVGLGIKGIGARIGFVDPEDASGTLALGVHVDAGTIVRNIHLTPYVEYWSTGVELGSLSADMSDLTLATDVNFDFPLQGTRAVPYLGGGVGLHFLSVDTNIPGADSDSRTRVGLNIQGGVRNQMWPNLGVFGEARYSFVDDANQLKLMGGFTYNFIY